MRKKTPSRRVLDGGNKVITKIVESISKPHKTYPQVVKEKRNAAVSTHGFLLCFTYLIAATCIVYC